MSNFLKLAAQLTLDGTRFKAGLKEAEKSANKFSNDLKNQFLGAFGAVAVIAATKGVIDLNSKIKDTADALGISTDAFQEQSYWITQSGAEVDDLKAAYIGLSKARRTALEGDTGKQAIFSALGISMEDLKSVPIEDVFKRAAESFRTIDFGNDKIAAVMEIFGKSGTKVIPALGSSLSDAADEAHRLGQVIDKDVNAALEAMGDRLDRLAGKGKNLMSVILDGAIKGVDMAATGLLMGGLKATDMGLEAVDRAAGIIGDRSGGLKFEDFRSSIAGTRGIVQDASSDLYNSMLDRYDPSASPIKSNAKSAALFGESDVADQDKTAKERIRNLEVEASLHEKIWRLSLDRMNAEEKAAEIQAKVNKLFLEQEEAYARQFSKPMSDAEKQSYLSKTAERMSLENSLYDLNYNQMLDEFDSGAAAQKQQGGDQSSLARVGQWQGINYQNTGESATVKAVKELLAPARQTAEGIQKIAAAPAKTINAGLR